MHLVLLGVVVWAFLNPYRCGGYEPTRTSALVPANPDCSESLPGTWHGLGADKQKTCKISKYEKLNELRIS
jgi:hypothetical protein